ncbi:MAG: CinA family protein [Nitrospirae bacterium]|nr:CinA family protein [Nitrospirota bacterium]
MKHEILQRVARVHELFQNKGLTLSVAESCTGGLVSHYITSLPGASAFFISGIIAYSEVIKKDILRVSPETILKYGVVSEDTAREMAEKIRILSKSDYALSTTGNLGPDVLEGKEKGLIYIAASREGKTVSHELKLKGDREANKEDAALAALRLLIELVDLN